MHGLMGGTLQCNMKMNFKKENTLPSIKGWSSGNTKNSLNDTNFNVKIKYTQQS